MERIWIQPTTQLRCISNRISKQHWVAESIQRSIVKTIGTELFSVKLSALPTKEPTIITAFYIIGWMNKGKNELPCELPKQRYGRAPR